MLLLTPPVFAQSGNSAPAVSGTVQDPSGANLSGAKVELLRAGDALEQTTLTDNLGAFRFDNVSSGPHYIQINQLGFKPVHQAINVGNPAPPPVRIMLQLSEQQEQVTVSAAATKVTTETAENTNSIDLSQQTLQGLPVFDLDYLGTLSRFLDQGDVATGGVTLVVNGIEANGPGVTSSAIKQAKINQDPYSPEFTRPGRGRIEITTEGGSPQYHGTFNFLFRDSVFNARETFAVEKPSEQRRFYEGSLTGPLKLWPKTYFLLSLDRDEEDIDSIVFADGPQGPIHENVPSPYRHWFDSGRISHDYAGGSSYWLGYSYEERSNLNQGVGGTVLPEAGTNTQFLEHEINFNHRYVASPKLVNQVQLFVGHYRTPTTSLNRDPKIVVLDAFTAGGAQADFKRTEYHFGLTDTVSWTSGRHLLKFGAAIPDWSRRAYDDFTNQAGTYYFSSLQDYALGKPFSLLLQRGQGRAVFLEKVLGGFVQDQIEVRPNLSVSVGVRYYWQNYFYDKPHNLAPRLSYAWAPGKSRKTVIRGGGGMFYDRTGPTPISDLLHFDGERLLRFLVENPAYPDPLVASPLLPAPPSIVQLDPRAKIPYQIQYSSGVERQLAKATTLAVNYIGNVFVDSYRSRDINAPQPPFYLARPNPAFGEIRQIESAGRGIGNALEITLRGNVTKYFSGTAQYTLSKTMNNTGGIAWFPADSNTLAGEWARADFDQRHRFNLMGAINLGKLMYLGVALAAYSGKPYSETTGEDNNNDGLALDRPPGVPRNSLEGPAYTQLDLRWSKDFFVMPSRKDKGPVATVGLDAFNVLNHTNFISYIGTLSSPLFGQAVAANPPRRLQLSLRFKF